MFNSTWLEMRNIQLASGPGLWIHPDSRPIEVRDGVLLARAIAHFVASEHALIERGLYFRFLPRSLSGTHSRPQDLTAFVSELPRSSVTACFPPPPITGPLPAGDTKQANNK